VSDPKVSDPKVSDPKRVSRLLIASCLASIWLVCWGALLKLKSKPWLRQRIHRTSRCALRLFRIGRAWLDACLHEGEELLVALVIPEGKSVR
jgi:hypothetical protein